MDFAVDNNEGYPSNEASDDNEAQETQEIQSEEMIDKTNAQVETPNPREQRSQQRAQGKNREQPTRQSRRQRKQKPEIEPPDGSRGDLGIGQKKKPTQTVQQAKVPAEEPVEGAIFCCQARIREEKGAKMVAMSATSDPDTMYFHQAMKQPDRVKFLKAV